jgi:ankyrin repeat protein
MSKTELIEAIKQDDLKVLEASTGLKELVNEEDDYGYTALHWVAGKGKPEIVKLLLGHGADVLKVGHDRRTPYQIALAAGHAEAARLLKEAEAKAGSDGEPPREYSKAYDLKDLRQFPGWLQEQRAASEESRDGGDDANGEAALKESEVVYLHSDLTVTRLMWRGEEVIFDRVTPEWKEFCESVLKFKVEDDLDLIVNS